ncbi:hypothetical protein Tco_0709584 [Tanacetum coccineum]
MEIVSPNHSKALAKWQVQPTRASMFSVSPSELLPLVDHLYPSNAVPSSKEKNEHSQFAFSICTSLNINHCCIRESETNSSGYWVNPNSVKELALPITLLRSLTLYNKIFSSCESS